MARNIAAALPAVNRPVAWPALARVAPDIIFENLAQTTAFQGGAVPTLNHPARREQPPAANQRPATALAGGCLPGSCHHRRNQPHTVTSGDTRFIANVLSSAANKFLFGRRPIRTLPFSSGSLSSPSLFLAFSLFISLFLSFRSRSSLFTTLAIHYDRPRRCAVILINFV